VLLPILAAAAVFALPLEIEPAGRRALAIATWMVLSWILEPLHPAVVGFAGCFLFVVSQCAEFDVAFGGFRSATPWFLYGALMLIVAAQTTGAVRRLAAFVPSGVTTSFLAASATVVIVALLTSVTIYSAAARAVIAVVAALALSIRLDAATGVSSRLPLVAVASYTAAVLGADGPTEPPSIAWRLLIVAICIGLAASFVRPAVEPSSAEEPVASKAGGRVMVLLGVAVLAWATMPLHGVSAGIIGLGAGLATAFPGMKPARDKDPKADPLALILAGAALSVPLVLAETRADVVLAAAPATVAALFDPRIDAPAKLALYQSPALILGAAVGGFVTRDVLRFGVPLALVGALVAIFAP
jgi:hypothetical protein